VVGALNRLQESDPDTYNSIINNTNTALNGTFEAGVSSLFDPTYAEAVSNAKTNLGVENLDFASEDHRVAIGDALTDILRAR
jgi:hypothetical protein